MKLIITLCIFYSVNIYASEFKKFEDYKHNKTLLQNDIIRLNALEHEKHLPLYQETLAQYKTLMQNYDRINSRLSLEQFSKSASESGWKEAAGKALELIPVCESEQSDYSTCAQMLSQIHLNDAESNAAPQSKAATKELLADYIEETNFLEVFDKEFITKFNENAKALNQTNTQINPSPAVELKPVKKIPKPIPVEVPQENINWEDYIPVAGGILIVSLLIFAIVFVYKNKKKKSEAIKTFYTNIFEVAQLSNREIKLFGHMDFLNLQAFSSIEKPFLETIVYSKPLAPMAHIIFNGTKKILKVDILFHSNQSVIELINFNENNETHYLREAVKELEHTIGDMGGELTYVNNFNLQGEIINSNLSISLPL